MKMNRISFLCFGMLFALMSSSVKGQGSYATFHFGYGLAFNSENLANFGIYQSSSTQSVQKMELIRGSFGKGLNISGSYGYMFNQNFGAELGISYLIGSTYEGNDISFGSSSKTIGQGKMLRLNPMMRFSSSKGSIRPYAKAGFMIGFGNIVLDHENWTGNDLEELKLKINGGMAFGLNTGFGVDFVSSEKLVFFSEIQFVSMRYSPKRGEITEWTINGADVLGKATTNDKEIIFVDEVTYTSQNPTPDSEPTKILKLDTPFSSVGLQLGVRFNF